MADLDVVRVCITVCFPELDFLKLLRHHHQVFLAESCEHKLSGCDLFTIILILFHFTKNIHSSKLQFMLSQMTSNIYC